MCVMTPAPASTAQHASPSPHGSGLAGVQRCVGLQTSGPASPHLVSSGVQFETGGSPGPGHAVAAVSSTASTNLSIVIASPSHFCDALVNRYGTRLSTA